mgnify:CR=1 FL=1
MIKKKPERIVIDLSRATYIDSAGMAVLILAMQEVEGVWRLQVFPERSAGKPCARFSKISRLDRTFRIFPDVDAALARPEWA